MNNWLYNNEPVEEPLGWGFVYLITNLSSGRMYVGKKNWWRTKKLPPLKGKKNKRHSRVESDWQTYYGSCAELTRDIAVLGHDKFKREILHVATSASELSYLETLEQFMRCVLLDDTYYNGIISCKINSRGVKNSALLKEVVLSRF